MSMQKWKHNINNLKNQKKEINSKINSFVYEIAQRKSIQDLLLSIKLEDCREANPVLIETQKVLFPKFLISKNVNNKINKHINKIPYKRTLALNIPSLVG